MGTHYTGTPEEVQALDTYIKLLRALNTVRIRIDEREQLGPLKGSPFGVLEMLHHIGPQTQTVIGKKLLVSKSNVVAIIDKLEKRKLVVRQRSTEDRRRIYVHLTEAGRAEIEKLLPLHVAAITRAMSSLDLIEQRQLGNLCRKLGVNEPVEDN